MNQVVATRPAIVKPPKPLWQQVWEHRLDYIFISPFYITWILFAAYPFFWGLQLSFGYWNGFGPIKWVGLENYIVVLKDPWLVKCLVNTFEFFIVSVPISLFIALLLAVLLNIKTLTGKGIFRTIYFMPYVTNTIMVGIVFIELFDDGRGWINAGLIALGLHPVGWLRNDIWAAKFVVVFLGLWQMLGYYILMFLGGLQAIEPELYEAATIDGANSWDQFWGVTLPLLKPIIFFFSVMATISLVGAGAFAAPYILTQGGPQGETTTLMLRIYQIGIQGLRYGDSAAFGFVVALMVIFIGFAQVRLQRAWLD
jgi:ABC-type sugar transport system permease subunit